MLSSHANPFTASQWAKLQRLLSCKDITLLDMACGGNSQLFCVAANGDKWAVKSYPPYAPNQRDRLAAEYQVYQFLNQVGSLPIPSLKACSHEDRWLIIRWIDGELPHTYVQTDIDQAIQFLATIANLNQTAAASNLPQAAEACLSLSILLDQITKRLNRLREEAPSEVPLQDFLANSFVPVFEKVAEQTIKLFQRHNMDMTTALPRAQQSLIPADFGFHNSLRTPDGQLTFFDFDYFGWDDPVKLLADIVWHPKMHLTEQQQARFIGGLSKIYQQDNLFLQRFYYTLPLFGLRWALILLNEFIPAFWCNRQHANVHQDQAKAKSMQLTRAKELLNHISSAERLHE